jgi:hypothetical protein
MLTAFDLCTREFLMLHAGISLSEEKIATALDKIVAAEGRRNRLPFTTARGSLRRQWGHWAYTNAVHAFDRCDKGKTVATGNSDDFRALAVSGGADRKAPLGACEGRIHKRLLQIELTSLMQVLGQQSQRHHKLSSRPTPTVSAPTG